MIQVTTVLLLLAAVLVGPGHGQLTGGTGTVLPPDPTQLLLAGILAATLLKKGQSTACLD
jgi:hypothetical protein